MEKRKHNMIINEPGGTASKGSESYKISIPTPWARDMGVSKESREVIMSYEAGKITIEKGNDRE